MSRKSRRHHQKKSPTTRRDERASSMSIVIVIVTRTVGELKTVNGVSVQVKMEYLVTRVGVGILLGWKCGFLLLLFLFSGHSLLLSHG